MRLKDALRSGEIIDPNSPMTRDWQ